jgi:hypothetical protein
MSHAQRSAAARNRVAATLVAFALPLATARADGTPNLVLPLATTAAIFAAEKPRRPPPRITFVTSGTVPRQPRQRLGLMPSQLHIPDLYSQEVDVNLPSYVEIVDNDKLVSFDLMRRPQRGWMASIAYSSEQRGPIPQGGGTLFSLTAELKF